MFPCLVQQNLARYVVDTKELLDSAFNLVVLDDIKSW